MQGLFLEIDSVEDLQTSPVIKPLMTVALGWIHSKMMPLEQSHGTRYHVKPWIMSIIAAVYIDLQMND
jgi:hypothetical protein